MRMSGTSWAVVLDGDGRVIASTSLPPDAGEDALSRVLQGDEGALSQSPPQKAPPSDIPVSREPAEARRIPSEPLEDGSPPVESAPDEPRPLVKREAAHGAPIRTGNAALPSGETLLLAQVDSTQAWSRMTRAFLHDVRGALNSQNLYLGLLRTRLEKRGVISDEIEKCLTRLGDQVPRIVGFCDAFAALASTSDRDDPEERDHDFETLARAAFDFTQTVGKRKEVAFEFSGSCPVGLTVEGVRVGEALVTLFGGILDAPEGTNVNLRLFVDDGAPGLAVSGLPANGGELIRGGLALFEALGANAEIAGDSATIRFPRGLVATGARERSSAAIHG